MTYNGELYCSSCTQFISRILWSKTVELVIIVFVESRKDKPSFFRMNFLSGLCALVVCCLFCFSLSLCQSMELPAEELNENQFNSPISSYRISLYLAIGAASSGKTFFKTPLTLSEDCIKTSRVIMQTFEKYTTMEATDEFLKSSIEEVLKHRNTSTFDNLVSMLCEELSKQAKQNSSIFQTLISGRKWLKFKDQQNEY